MLSRLSSPYENDASNAPHTESAPTAIAAIPQSRRCVAGDGMLGDLAALSLSLRHRQRGMLASHEVSLAGYLLGRAVMAEQDAKDEQPEIKQPLDSADLQRLRLANDTVHETRARFPYGRGNVRPDIAASNHECSRRSRTTRDMLQVLERHKDTRALFMHSLLARASIAECVQGGLCKEYGAIATVLHSAKRRPEESVHLVDHLYRKHSFVVSRVPAGHHKTIVMDAWAQGPAVLAPDSEFASRQACTAAKFSVNHDDTTDLPAEMAVRTRYFKDNMSAFAEAHLQRLKAMDFRYSSELWQPQPVVSEAFRAVVKRGLAAALSAPQPAFRLPQPVAWGAVINEMKAVAAARSLGVRVPAATHAAEAIVESALRLGE